MRGQTRASTQSSLFPPPVVRYSLTPMPAARRQPLSRDRVIDAAVAFADDKGFEALSMRELADRLGVEAMSLYNHVPNKEALLIGIVERIIGEVEVPPPGPRPAGDWKKRIVSVARSYRAMGHRHPNIFPLLLLRACKPSRSLRPVEAVLQALLDAGFERRAAVGAQRTILGFVRGYTLWEIGGFVSGKRSGPGCRAHPEIVNELLAMDPADFPCVVDLASELVGSDPGEEFESGLESILHGIEATAPRATVTDSKSRKSARATPAARTSTRRSKSTPR